MGWILAVSFAIMLVVARRGRNKLAKELTDSERLREALNLENFDLAEENARYKGTLEAIAPADGEIWETKIHYPAILDDEINKQIRAAGMRPWGENA